jgi:hypothetical protein
MFVSRLPAVIIVMLIEKPESRNRLYLFPNLLLLHKPGLTTA